MSIFVNYFYYKSYVLFLTYLHVSEPIMRCYIHRQAYCGWYTFLIIFYTQSRYIFIICYSCLDGAVDDVLDCQVCDRGSNHGHGKSHNYVPNNMYSIADESSIELVLYLCK